MKWLEISVDCQDEEAVAAVRDLFEEINGPGSSVVELGGFDAVGEIPEPKVTVRTYVSLAAGARDRRDWIQQGLGALSQHHGLATARLVELAEEDWSTAWRAHFSPLRVGQRLLVLPAWEQDHESIAPERVAILIDPGMAFGTGQHLSTQLCLEALERHVTPGTSVLDVGCGSGILAIAAARLGATPVLALDVDPIAVGAARENSRRNGVEHLVQVEGGSLPHGRGPAEGWDLILVNILAAVIVQLLEEGLAGYLAQHGRLVLGGIIEPHAEEVIAALASSGMLVCETKKVGDWMLIEAVRA